MEFLLFLGLPGWGLPPGKHLPACNYDVATSKNASRQTQNAHFTMLNEQTFTGCYLYTPPMDMTYGHGPCPGARPTQIFWSIEPSLIINSLVCFSKD